MKLSLWQFGIACVVAFVVGGIVCRGDSSGDALQRSADSLAIITDSLWVLDTKRQQDSAAAAKRIAGIEAGRRVLVLKAARQEQALDSLGRLVLDTASVVPRPVYDSTLTTYRSLVQTREAERDSAVQTALLWRGLYVSADSSAKAWRNVATVAQQQLGIALKQRKWGCYGGVGASLGYGFIGDRSGVGTVAGLSVTCGKRL